MNTYENGRSEECPSWQRLARYVDEGGREIRGHVRDCPHCATRYELVLGLYGMAAGTGIASSEECPSVADWIALASGKVEAGHRRRLGEHLSSCDACARLFRNIVGHDEPGELEWELHDAASPMEVASLELAVVSRSRSPAFLVRAAAVVLGSSILIAVASGAFPRIGVGGDERWRGPSPSLSASVQRGGEGARPTLRWEVWPDATSYRVRVWDRVGNELIDRSLASDTQTFELALDQLSPGVVLMWQVEALRGGVVIAKASPARLVWNGR